MKTRSFSLTAVVVLFLCSVSSAGYIGIDLRYWKANPVQRIDDKIFTLTSTTLVYGGQVELISGDIGSGEVGASMRIFYMSGESYTLNYTVAIDQAMSPSKYFVTAHIFTSITLPSGAATETIFESDPDLVLSTTRVARSQLGTIPGALKFLTIHDTCNGCVTTLVNDFSEVPEPAALFLFGLGGMVLRRNMKLGY